MRRRKTAGILAGALLAAAVGVIPAKAALDTPAPSGGPAGIDRHLLVALDAAGPGTQLEVLVGATSADAAESAIRKVGLDPFLTFEKVAFSSTTGSASAIRALAEQDGVTYVQLNRPLQPMMNTAPTATRVPEAETAYAASAPVKEKTRPDQSKRGNGDKDGHVEPAPGDGVLDGSGVGIAVVDSGMAGDHPMFTDASGKTRLLNIKQACVNLFECGATVGDEPDEYFINATGLDTDVMATGGHGTHVTAIAGGREITTSNGVSTRGIARNSSLYGIGAGAGIFVINAVASLNWVLEHHADPCGAFSLPPVDVAGGCAPIKVVNNSYGSPGDYDPRDVYAVISERLVLEGVTVVWAAGNGDEITSTNPLPNDGSVNLTNPPGQSPKAGVLMVANYDDQGSGRRDGGLNSTSSRGHRGRPETYPDFAAPGTDILAACRPWLPICTSSYADPNYGEISGTSMAAPLVAGIVALLLEIDPTLTPEMIEDLLEDTAHKFGDPNTYEPDVASAGAVIPNQVRNADDTTSFDKGHGLVDLAAALYALRGQTDPGPSAGACSTSVLTDPEGDATALTGIGPNVPVGLPTPDVDIVTTTASSAGTALRFTVGVADLPEMPLSRGDAVRSFFTVGEKSFILDMNRRLGTSGAIETTWALSTPDPADTTGLTNIVLARGQAVFDAAADVAYADLPLDLLGTTVDSLGGVRVLWRRSGEAVAAPADELSGGCPLLVS